MEPLLIGVTLFSLALALVMSFVSWRLLRQARDRESARAEALRAHALDASPADARAFDHVRESPHAAPIRTEDRTLHGARHDWDAALAAPATGNDDWSRSRPEADAPGASEAAPLFSAAPSSPHNRWLPFAAVALVAAAVVAVLAAWRSPEVTAALAASHTARASDETRALSLLSLSESVDANGVLTVA